MLCMLPSQCPTSSTLSPGTAPLHSYNSTTSTLLGAALHIDSAKFCLFHTFFGWGIPMCTWGSAPLFSHLLWMGQFCVWVPQHFATSTISPGEATPHEHTVSPHYLCTFPGQGSPEGRYYSILSSTFSSGWGDSGVNSPAGAQSRTLLYPLYWSPGEGAPCIFAIEPPNFCWV